MMPMNDTQTTISQSYPAFQRGKVGSLATVPCPNHSCRQAIFNSLQLWDSLGDFASNNVYKEKNKSKQTENPSPFPSDMHCLYKCSHFT